MSVATTTSQSFSRSSTRPRPATAGRIAALRRVLQRRRADATAAAHQPESASDAYIDRHGAVQLDARTITAYLQR